MLFCTTLYYKVLLQYYSVLQRPTPYYKVLQSTSPGTTKDYSILQSTTPVLVCITKYFSVLKPYYKVPQSTTPLLLCTTKTYSVLQSTSPGTTKDYSIPQSTTPVRLCITNCITKYHKVLLQYSSVLQSVSPYYKVLLQYDCVTQYVTLHIDPPYIWNRSEFRMPKRVLWARASTETCVKRTQLFCTTFQKIVHLYHPLLRVCSHIFPIIPLLDSGKLFEFVSPMHCWTLTMIHHLQCASSKNHPPTSPVYHEKWLSSLIGVTHETSFAIHGATWFTL